MYSQTVLALFASIAAAQLHAPVGDTPSGNPITRPLNEVVPACKAFTITWTPTTPNTVSLLLLRGPSNNVQKLGPALAEGIANSGSFVWTPSASLEADTSRYGLQLIDDVTGQYQYSTQFGISTADCGSTGSSSSAKPASSSIGGGYPVNTPTPSLVSSKPASSSAASSKANSTTPAVSKSTPIVYSTGVPTYNTTVIVQPSKPISLPSSLAASATSSGATATRSAPPESTGAAGSLRAGLGLVGAMAAAVFVL